MTDEGWKQSIVKTEATYIDDFVVFTDSQGNCYRVATNAELYGIDKKTGEVKFHFPVNLGVSASGD